MYVYTILVDYLMNYSTDGHQGDEAAGPASVARETGKRTALEVPLV